LIVDDNFFNIEVIKAILINKFKETKILIIETALSGASSIDAILKGI